MITLSRYYRCPQCGHHLGWLQRCKLAPLGVQKIIPCPSCKEPLEWSKWPHHLITIGSVLPLIVMAAAFLNMEGKFMRTLLLIAAGVTLLGASLNKIESHTHHKNSN
jgi:endogenous inhibitor of DNA gyrase (YacG/DUF329 family)